MFIRHLGPVAGIAVAMCLPLGTAHATTFGYVAKYSRTNGAAQSHVVQSAAQGFTAAIAVDSTGKTIVITNALPYPSGFIVGRYNPDFSIDTTFGYFGVTTVDAPHNGSAVDVAVDSSNNIYVLGSAPSGPIPTSTYVAKFRTDGSLDPSYGSHGIATVSGTQGPDKLALRSNGVSAVLWGRGNGGQGGFHFALLGSGGNIVFNRADSFVAQQPDDVASAIAFDDVNDVVIAGQSGGKVAITEYGPDSGFRIVNYNSGKAVLIDFGRSGQRAADVAADSLGNVIVVGGVTTQTDEAEFLLAKTDPSGTLLFRRDFVRGGAAPAGAPPGVSNWSVLVSGSFYWVAGSWINDNGFYQQNLFKINSRTFDFQTDFAHSGWMHDGIETYGTSLALDISLDLSLNPIVAGFVSNP